MYKGNSFKLLPVINDVYNCISQTNFAFLRSLAETTILVILRKLSASSNLKKYLHGLKDSNMILNDLC